MAIVIPMAGQGSRFSSAGYKDPKPFIKVNGKFMIMSVIENIGVPCAKYIFICQKEHLAVYGSEFIEQIKSCSFVKDFEIIGLDGQTEGSACTVLTAEKFIDNNEELLIVNSDQLLGNLDILNSIRYFEKENADGGIICFFNQNPQWSYVSIDANRLINRVEEKKQISDHATVGVYWFLEGKSFVSAAKEMIKRNDRSKNEFYLAPVYNYMLIDNKKIKPYFINEFHGLGTPDDLQKYLLTGKP